MKAAARTSCDKKDRHVLAAADYSPAQTLVTFNLKDFPDSSTIPLGIEIKHPDDFLLDVFDLAPGRVATICYTALLSYKEYPQTPEDEGGADGKLDAWASGLESACFRWRIGAGPLTCISRRA